MPIANSSTTEQYADYDVKPFSVTDGSDKDRSLNEHLTHRMDKERNDTVLEWSHKIEASRQQLKQALARHEFQKVATSLILRYREIYEQDGQCFLPGTMLWVTPFESKAVDAFKQGDTLLGLCNHELRIRDIYKFEEDIQDIVQLKTREVTLQVTASHRVCVPDERGEPLQEKCAGQLEKGEKVFVGEKAVPLVSVTRHRMRTSKFMLHLLPDKPVSAFQPPRWGLATFGQTAYEHSTAYPDTDDESGLNCG
eukprot:TRINITY_DN12305_c0_g1_i2.p1 TRINITY_DN12305_c0_g1~~TRINITY_DN12305_c0_g1_i2.p1  ORF type:complete len:252 (+),score=41.99 TRINITY_DN12305_c0_g1_i2:179-934(+)